MKATSQTPVVRAIRNQITITCRDLGMSVDGDRGWVTLGHASPLKNIGGVLSLRQNEAVGGARDGDPKEVVKIT
jgi:hypothetical protein